ncbi:hypothetical protein HU200_022387 [Digitaria exilis]|uniref:RNase H type-1 domain-containing protein n=1 Tax=Digitaria exilis TaxID=1010633 RepID=A0A835C4M3_9POAL|nr:hypothetical protein HU200_022387 [Digitaria exilis]
MGHLFLKCKDMRLCWLLLNMEELRVSLISQNSAKGMLEEIWSLQKEVQQKIILLLWCWWSARNKVNAGERRKSADSAGLVVAAGAGASEFLMDAEHAETVACFKGIEHAARLGLDKIIVESDAASVVNAIKDSEHNRSPLATMFREIRVRLMYDFSFGSVSYCPRACNSIAHTLAAMGLNCNSDPLLWDESVPGYVSVLVSWCLGKYLDRVANAKVHSSKKKKKKKTSPSPTSETWSRRRRGRGRALSRRCSATRTCSPRSSTASTRRPGSCALSSPPAGSAAPPTPTSSAASASAPRPASSPSASRSTASSKSLAPPRARCRCPARPRDPGAL